MTFEVATLSEEIKSFGSIVVGPFEVTGSLVTCEQGSIKDRNKSRIQPAEVLGILEAKRKRTDQQSSTTSDDEESSSSSESSSASIILLSSDDESDGDSEVYDYEQFKREQSLA